MTKIAIDIHVDDEFCGHCKLLKLSNSPTWCMVFDMSLEWGGKHNHLLKRCQQCIDAEIGKKINDMLHQ